MKTFLTLTIVQTFSLFCYGFTLPLQVILEKSAALNGRQIFSVEQDVYFKEGAQEVAIHESWQIDSDRNMKLIATGLGELKDSVRIVNLYLGKNKVSVTGKNRITETGTREFFEKYLAVRTAESFKNYLNELTIAPNVRLARANGAVAFAIGEPSQPAVLKPQLWVNQDTFKISQIRFPSEADVAFDDYSEINKQLQYPKTKRIEWAGKTVLIKVRSVNDKFRAQPNAFSAQALDIPSELLVSNKGSLGLMIEEFYKRFR